MLHGPIALVVELRTTDELAGIAEAIRRATGHMFYFTYVLKSNKDNRLYIGSSGDIKTRLKAHNAGDVEATRNRRPLELVYFEACLRKSKAEQRERYFKTGFGRGFLKTRI